MKLPKQNRSPCRDVLCFVEWEREGAMKPSEPESTGLNVMRVGDQRAMRTPSEIATVTFAQVSV